MSDFGEGCFGSDGGGGGGGGYGATMILMKEVGNSVGGRVDGFGDS